MQAHKTTISEERSGPILRVNKDPKFTPQPTTLETFWKLKSLDPSGHAFQLYTFYAAIAVKQGSSQPWASDQFCANGLGWSYNSVVKYRKLLIKAGVITHIQKKSYFFIRVHFITVDFPNHNFNLSEDDVPQDDVFDYYAVWYDRLEGCMDIFTNRLKKKMGLAEKPDLQTVIRHVAAVYGRMCKNGYDDGPTNEKRFWGYLMKGVETELNGGSYQFNDFLHPRPPKN